MEDVPDWSGLVPELVAEIAGRLQNVEDFTALRGVCRSWRAATSKKDFGAKSKSVPFPLMMTSNKFNEWQFYSFYKEKVLLRVSMPEAERCLPVEFGWFLIVNYSSALIKEMNLVHLSSRAQIKLPNFNGYITSTSLSANPSDDPSNFVLLVGSVNSVGSWRPGEQNLTRRKIGLFENLIFWKQNFYAIDWESNLWALKYPYDISDMHVMMTLDTRALCDQMFPYLVKSSDGELLIVYDNNDHNDRQFVVVSLDVVRREWKIIDDLEKDAVLISYSVVLCVRASPDTENDAIKPNCIYFVDTSTTDSEAGEEDGYDLDVLNMKDKERFKVKAFHSFFTPMWVNSSILLND